MRKEEGKLDSATIRERFITFFEEKGHTRMPSWPLILKDDPSVLFTSASMQPLVPYFLGKKGTRGCMRSEEHTSELQSRFDLVCRLLLEKNYITISSFAEPPRRPDPPPFPTRRSSDLRDHTGAIHHLLRGEGPYPYAQLAAHPEGRSERPLHQRQHAAPRPLLPREEGDEGLH